MIRIKNTTEADEPAIRKMHKSAFGPEEGQIIADLTIELLHDPTAKPVLSLLACEGEVPIGHVLFTSVQISGAQASPPPAASILAPLAVLPERQRQGTGTELVQKGLAALTDAGCRLVFVLGYPSYYPRFGFEPAGRLGLSAPYTILEKNADAWMVLELKQGTLGTVRGTVRCAEALDKPEYWCE